MVKLSTQLHEKLLPCPDLPDPAFLNHLASRRQQLLNMTSDQANQLDQLDQQDAMNHEEFSWLARTYPVLAVLAPVMKTTQGKIEYPGDPMCLYSALSVAIEQVGRARKVGLLPTTADITGNKYVYNDLCPRWGSLPSAAYRSQISDSGIRDYSAVHPNTDQTIFDPRLWNEETRRHFVQILKRVQPRVVLISCVSPAHRYAIDIARHVRQHLPDTLIVFGGRHMDETMRFQDAAKELILLNSSTLSAISDGRIDPIVDFIISGDGYFALDLLMKAISAAMSLQQRTAAVADVVHMLNKLAPLMGSFVGSAVLAALDGSTTHVFPLRGPTIDLAQLPSPYQAAGIRARFPIFQVENGEVARTAHMMITSACPYHCSFCSEGITVVGKILRFSRTPVAAALCRVLEYVSYGAEAIFFDDSIFWAGNTKRMQEFSTALIDARTQAETCAVNHLSWMKDQKDLERLRKLQWGAQLTAEFLSTLHTDSQMLQCLKAMRTAGCTYIYMGIESLASSVMNKVHKNLHTSGELSWAEKIRKALLLASDAGIRVGSSVLFGLDSETRETIETTIEGVGQVIDEGLLYLASPNILTYHPATAITSQHGKENQLDYHSLDIPHHPPYTYFEEAFPGVVSKELSEDDIWYIHWKTKERWGNGRYMDSPPLIQSLSS